MEFLSSMPCFIAPPAPGSSPVDEYHSIGVDTYCAGCCRMLVNTKFYDGMQPTMPEITGDDLRYVGLPPEDLYEAPPVSFKLNCAW